MPTLDEHWRIVQDNMDAIKRIVDGMEQNSTGLLCCYFCDTAIADVPYSIGGRQFCSRHCIDQSNCGAAEHKRQVEEEEGQ